MNNLFQTFCISLLLHAIDCAEDGQILLTKLDGIEQLETFQEWQTSKGDIIWAPYGAHKSSQSSENALNAMLGIKLLKDKAEFGRYYRWTAKVGFGNMGDRAHELKVLTEHFGAILKDENMKTHDNKAHVAHYQVFGAENGKHFKGYDIDLMFNNKGTVYRQLFETEGNEDNTHGLYVSIGKLGFEHWLTIRNVNGIWVNLNDKNKNDVPFEYTEKFEGVMKYFKSLYVGHNEQRETEWEKKFNEKEKQQKVDNEQPIESKSKLGLVGKKAIRFGKKAKLATEKAAMKVSKNVGDKVRERKLRVYIVKIGGQSESKSYQHDGSRQITDDGVRKEPIIDRRRLLSENSTSGFYWSLLTVLIVISVGVSNTFMLIR